MNSQIEKDLNSYLEMAHLGMAMVGQELCDEMDISDKEFLRLQDNLEKHLGKD